MKNVFLSAVLIVLVGLPTLGFCIPFPKNQSGTVSTPITTGIQSRIDATLARAQKNYDDQKISLDQLNAFKHMIKSVRKQMFTFIGTDKQEIGPGSDLTGDQADHLTHMLDAVSKQLDATKAHHDK